MIYHINFGIGWASSGVEYAQKYRAAMLRSIKAESKFVFLDFLSNENIQTLTANLGFQDDEVIWLYQYFTDIKIHETTYTIEDIKKTISNNIQTIETSGKIARIILEGEGNFITCYLKEEGKDFVDRAEFVLNGFLIRKDYYSYTRIFSEYYAPFENKAKVYMRHFYNEDGTIAYKEFIDGDNSMYDFNDQKLYSKEAFVAYFMQRLALTSKDIVILDRATKIGQAVLQNKGDSKLGVVIHAEHFSENATNDDYILWNNFYDYQFTQAKHIDFYITATNAQNKLLVRQFKKYMGITPKVFTIPVGSLSSLKVPKSPRKGFGLITASRLANEKHVDWMVRAVIKAKQQLPELTFDIYGEGAEKAKINQLIREHQAENYIKTHGHQQLDNLYQKYELFLSASQSEGFGLTLMEAVGSGLGMLGFDVNYGNPTFIKDGKNGFLLPINLDQQSIEETINAYAEKIVAFYQVNLDQVHKQSYKIAKPFMTENVENMWAKLIEEVQHD